MRTKGVKEMKCCKTCRWSKAIPNYMQIMECNNYKCGCGGTDVLKTDGKECMGYEEYAGLQAK